MVNRQLLCTFSNNRDFNNIIKEIFRFYDVYNSKIFIFYNVKNDKEKFITYNVINDSNGEIPKFPNTISIHRKKQFNTLYSLNALNILIKEENGGVWDKTYQVNWNLFENSLIITGDISIRVIPIKIFTVVTD